MPAWIEPYRIRRSTKMLSFAVRQNHSLLQLAGEAVFLLKRLHRANAPFQVSTRRVSTITKVVSSFDTDPETGFLRGLLWEQGVTSDEEYPDQGVFTATVQASGGTNVWEQALDKYSFIANRNEYCFDELRDDLDINGNLISNKVYIIMNTPPFHATDTTICNFGIANPLTNFKGMQPIRDNQVIFENSLFGFEQWLKPTARIRTRVCPHRFLLAFPGVLDDITLTDAGLLRQSKSDYWTTPAPYSPVLVEHDMIMRESTGQRFQITNHTPIYIEDILVSQHMDLAELEPRSSMYQIPIITS